MLERDGTPAARARRCGGVDRAGDGAHGVPLLPWSLSSLLLAPLPPLRSILALRRRHSPATTFAEGARDLAVRLPPRCEAGLRFVARRARDPPHVVARGRSRRQVDVAESCPRMRGFLLQRGHTGGPGGPAGSRWTRRWRRSRRCAGGQLTLPPVSRDTCPHPSRPPHEAGNRCRGALVHQLVHRACARAGQLRGHVGGRQLLSAASATASVAALVRRDAQRDTRRFVRICIATLRERAGQGPLVWKGGACVGAEGARQDRHPRSWRRARRWPPRQSPRALSGPRFSLEVPVSSSCWSRHPPAQLNDCQ